MHLPTPSTTKFVRDAVLFTVGLAAAIQQVFFVTQHDPVLLTFVAAMLGLPAVLQQSERKKATS